MAKDELQTQNSLLHDEIDELKQDLASAQEANQYWLDKYESERKRTKQLINIIENLTSN